MRQKTTVGKKLALTCAILVACCLVQGSFTIFNIGAIDRSLHTIVIDSLPGVESIGRIANQLQGFESAAWKHIAVRDPREVPAIERKMASLKQEIQKSLQDYEKTITLPEDRAMYNKLAPAQQRYFQAWDRVQPISRESRHEEAFARYMADAEPAFQAAQEATTMLVVWNRDNGNRNVVVAEAASSSARFWTWLMLGASVVVGSLLGWTLVRGVNGVLRQAVGELAEGAGQMDAAATQISSSSQSLAQEASEQAASLEETSASGEEINAMARRNTDNSRAAADLVAASQEKFVETSRLLEETVSSMGEIKSSSDRISRIIKTIDEIAFQTNILALNAAVEAARAGEAGMGFAVVADEVRNLAQRCAQAARDTASLIEESIARSGEGQKKVDEVAAAIRAVIGESARVKTLVDEVNESSQEQARGIEQIAKAVVRMEQVTQSSAANAEESASAAEELNAQSRALRQVVERLSALVGAQGAT